jgi:3-hydroxyacyl-[acyl-carrier-protein] dehydratase
MRFALIDRITDFEPGRRLSAVKNLSMAEEYLQDHFPLFPIMPGVLMLESLYQASTWLVRCSEDFAHSVVQLGEAKNVKFNDFVEPGQTLAIETAIKKEDENRTWINASGTVSSRSAVKAVFVLERFNLADRQLASSQIDAYIVDEFRRQRDNLMLPSGAATS